MKFAQLPTSALAIAFLAGLATGQDAASKTYFLLSSEQGTGGQSQSTTYKLDCSIGGGVVAGRATTSTYALTGGFPGTLENTSTGQPMLAGVLPRYAALRSGVTLTLHGTELNLGPTPTVKIGGQTTTISNRQNHRLTVKLPNQPKPGWVPVEVSNTTGTAVLPKGIGILPLLEADPAPASFKDFAVHVRGSKGDAMVVALGFVELPNAIKIGTFGHGLLVHPSFMLTFTGFQITRADGVLTVPVQAIGYGPGIVLQALIATQNPAYAPGSFTNLLRL